MSNEYAKNDELIDMINGQREEIIHLRKELQERENYEFMYNRIISSKSWRVTSSFRKTVRLVKMSLALRFRIKMFRKFINSLIHDGVSTTFYKVRSKLEQLSYTPIAEADGDFVDVPHGYASTYQDNMEFTGTPYVKVLAFYLPQFYSFPENDKWWGKGFTEWTNTRKALSLFAGHYQPREPHDDIGYYNLTDPTVLKKQAELAKKHGIYGFCIYYYWFSGKRLMEKPLDILLDHSEIDINFCLCWANGNWTRRWDGHDKDILIAQEHKVDDPVNFIHDLRKYIEDKRYIRVHGKPVIIVYNPAEINNVKNVFEQWKEEALKTGIGEISIWICIGFGSARALGLTDIVDKEIEFPPHDMPHGMEENIPNTLGFVFNYSRLVHNIMAQRKTCLLNKKLYRTVMMGWDNSARKKEEYYVFDKYDLKRYYDWLVANINEAKTLYDFDERFVFINAWNEWGEGTYLEPDKKYGYANINTTSKAIFNLPFDVSKKYIRHTGKKARIAVQAHIVYPNLATEFMNYINNIPEAFDCYITTDSMGKAMQISDVFKGCVANKFEIDIVDNRGRDVAPMILQLQRHMGEYEIVCHIHTMKTNCADYFDKWREYLLNNLLGSRDYVNSIIKAFDDNKKLGIVYPGEFPLIKDKLIWAEEKENIKRLTVRLGLNIDLDRSIGFPTGNMFWFRGDAVRQIFNYGFSFSDFPIERGQESNTIMHAVERLWIYLADFNGYDAEMKMVNNNPH